MEQACTGVMDTQQKRDSVSKETWRGAIYLNVTSCNKYNKTN